MKRTSLGEPTAEGPRSEKRFCVALHTVLIRDDRKAIASDFAPLPGRGGDGWADIIDLLTIPPEARRRVARELGEIVAFW